jgi:uncharacterized membrane protein YhaH (DUF805 family)
MAYASQLAPSSACCFLTFPDLGRYGAQVATVSPANFFFAFLVAAAAGTAVFFHAERNRIRHPSAWASFVFLLLIIGLPSYALHVRRVRRARQPP